MDLGLKEGSGKKEGSGRKSCATLTKHISNHRHVLQITSEKKKREREKRKNSGEDGSQNASGKHGQRK